MKKLRLTKTMLDSLDPSHMAMDIRLDDPRAGLALSFALSTVESYLAEAAVQQRRIVREQRAIRTYLQTMRLEGAGNWQNRRRHHRPNRLRSVHFYLTCWRMIDRHLDLVSRTSGLAEVKAALRPRRHTLGQYRQMRDHYEHIDERLPGRRGVRRMAVPSDLGNFIGYTLSFGGERVDIGPNSLLLLKRIVNEILTGFKLGAIRTVSVTNPRVVQGWFAPLRLKYLNRYIKRQMTKTAVAQRKPKA